MSVQQALHIGLMLGDEPVPTLRELLRKSDELNKAARRLNAKRICFNVDEDSVAVLF